MKNIIEKFKIVYDKYEWVVNLVYLLSLFYVLSMAVTKCSFTSSVCTITYDTDTLYSTQIDTIKE